MIALWLACAPEVTLPDPADLLFAQLDQNRDQKLTPADSEWAGLRDVLRDLDTDDGGYVDAGELRAYLASWPDRSEGSSGPVQAAGPGASPGRGKAGKAGKPGKPGKAKGRRR